MIIIDSVLYGIADLSKDISHAKNIENLPWASPLARGSFLTMKAFLFLDFLIMLISFYKIRKALKQFPQLSANKCTVFLYFFVMALMCIAGVLQFFLDGVEPEPIYYFGSCFLSSMVIAYLIYLNSKTIIKPS